MEGYSYKFGGDWTSEKLLKVSKYLSAYSTIMKKQGFRFAYIDAFAGTGYINKSNEKESDEILMFPEMTSDESLAYLDGSAKIALKTKPDFEKYLFIEKSDSRARELQKLTLEFPEKASRIQVVQTEANEFLQEMCLNCNWTNHRAVLFLDPYGMQVEYKTIEAIAKTKAIDLWILFPAGMAINRLLKCDGKISDNMAKALDRIFGTNEWYNTFYKTEKSTTFFGENEIIRKNATFEQIGTFFINRLKTIFSGVSDKPAYLNNSKNNPLFMLCFASGNPIGSKTAVKIADFILGN